MLSINKQNADSHLMGLVCYTVLMFKRIYAYMSTTQIYRLESMSGITIQRRRLVQYRLLKHYWIK